MKRFVLSVLSACAMAVCAQTPYSALSNENDAYLNAHKLGEHTKVITKSTQVPQGARKAMQLDDLTAMFEQPEGELMLMRRSGTDYLPYYGTPTPASYEDKGTYVVKGTDGNYYFKNFVTNMCNGGAWVKGTVHDNVISVPTGQICTQLWYDNGETNEIYTYYLYALDYEVTTEVDPYYGQEYDVYTYFPNLSIESIDFQINEDGSLSYLNEDIIYGGVEEIDGELTWPGYGDMNCTFVPFSGEPQVAPESVDYNEYIVKYLTYTSDTWTFANVGFMGDKVYIQGLAQIIPEGIIEGTIKGDKVEFATNQFLGVDGKYSTLVYMMASKQYMEEDEWGWQTYYFDFQDGLTMSYDADSKSFSTTDGTMLINVGNESVLHHEQYTEPTFKIWQEVATKPANPEWLYYMPYTEAEWGSWGYAGFNIYNVDVDGNYIQPEKICYICYLDDVPMVVSNAESGEDMTEIPYNYADNDIIGGGSEMHVIYFYEGGFEKFGVQSVNYSGDERMTSDICYYVDESASITPVQSQAVSTLITDIQGRIRTNLGKGINIVTITYADGSRKSTKLLIK